MRTIKFRAWDITNKVMIDKPYLHFVDGESFYLAKQGEKTRSDLEFELMQFTGLKDKNGKEIYSGDYLKQEGLEVEVKWSEFDAGFIFEDDSGSHMNVTSGNSYVWEVIGNIYEDKKLLK